MINGDAAKYLAHIDLDPSTVVNCASFHCHKRFRLAKGFAAEVIIDQQGVVFFFCSQACYLHDIPAEYCARA